MTQTIFLSSAVLCVLISSSTSSRVAQKLKKLHLKGDKDKRKIFYFGDDLLIFFSKALIELLLSSPLP